MVAQPSVIFSTFIGPGHGAITLRGEIGSGAAEEFGAHLEAFLGAATRSVTVNATDVTYYVPRVLELLAQARRRFGARAGVVSVHGLHPSALPPRVPDALGTTLAPAPTPAAPPPAA